MSIESIGGYSSSLGQAYGSDPVSQPQGSSAAQGQDSMPTDKQALGAAVVSKTLDYMNGQDSSGLDAAPMDKQTLGAAVVSKTLDYMNSGGLGGGNNGDYDFQTKVLEGGLAAKGLMVNDKV